MIKILLLIFSFCFSVSTLINTADKDWIDLYNINKAQKSERQKLLTRQNSTKVNIEDWLIKYKSNINKNWMTSLDLKNWLILLHLMCIQQAVRRLLPMKYR